MPKTKKNNEKVSPSDAEKALLKAAKRIENAGIRDYMDFMSSPWKIFGVNFLVGTARGLGLILGVSLVLAIVGYVLTQILSDLPIVGDFFSSLYDFLRANGLPETNGITDVHGAPEASSEAMDVLPEETQPKAE